jgi:hypothetical protein
MKLTNDGLTLWYGTPDAPAPFDDEVVPRQGTSVVVGVQPPNPTNAVLLRFRVDGGAVQTAPGREIRNDYDRKVQYFSAAFPPFPTGDLVEYSPMLTCAGRQVPPAHLADRFRSKFQLEPRDAPAPGQARPPTPTRAAPARAAARPSASNGQRHFGAGMEFVATVSLRFEPLQFIGENSWGMRVNLVICDATVVGKDFKGKMLEASADNMLVRRDGMGVVRMRAAIAIDDGAMLDVESGGYVDFGADGYRRAVSHALPDRSPVVVSPLIWTRHPKYAWLSRLQCIGVGETHLDACQARYDIYAATPQGVSAIA